MALVTPFLASQLARESLAAATQGVAGSVGQFIDASTTFDKGDGRQLGFLRNQQQAGVGMREPARQRMESRQANTRGGTLRSQQANRGDRMAGLAAGGLIGAEELFLAEQGAMEGEQELRMREAQEIQAADELARQRRRQRIMELEAREREARRLRRRALGQTILSTTLGIGLPFLEKGVNARRARLAEQGTTASARRMSGGGISTPVGAYGGVFGRNSEAALEPPPAQVAPTAGRARSEYFMGADEPMTLEQAFAAVRE